MKQIEHEIKTTLGNALKKASPSVSFTALWSMHVSKNKSHFRFKKAALVPTIVILSLFVFVTVGFAGVSISRLVDDTDLPFVEDPQIIGKWQSVDLVKDIEDFDPAFKRYEPELYLNELVFIKEGKMLDRFRNTNLSYSGSNWTRGFVIDKDLKTSSKYDIKNIDGSNYMFMEWKSGDYITRFMKPRYYVLKQTDTEDYSNYEVQKIEDKVDYPFVNAPEMLGKWESVDFVKSVDDFNPNKIKNADISYIKELSVLEEGKMRIQKVNGSLNSTLTWTKGLILDVTNKIASKCEIKEIDGQNYMFFEWKSGDYSYRGASPSYYVLKKVD